LSKCKVCKPNYYLKDEKCIRCSDAEGYDPISKECFNGVSLSEFTDTQFGNLKAATTNIDLINNYFLATYRYTIDQKNYSHNGFLLFINNIENCNRQLDFCWDSECIKNQQGIYYALSNTKQKLTLERFIIGNTSINATIPASMIFGMKTKDMIDQNSLKHKNFSCSIFGNLVYQPTDNYYGKCVSECQSGYYRDPETQKCIRCNSNCLTCTGPQTCNTCKRRYTLVKNECIACQAPCVTCDSSPHKCLTCFTSNMFNLLTNTCDMYCTEKKGCTKCDFNSGKCFACSNNFELNNDQCEPRDCGLENCSICTVDEKNCRVCKPGYVLQDDKCVICRQNCSECPMNYQLHVGACIPITKNDIIHTILSIVLVISIVSL